MRTLFPLTLSLLALALASPRVLAQENMTPEELEPR